MAKDMAAGNENLGSGARRRTDGLQVNTAIDFDAEVHLFGGTHGRQLADLLDSAGNERLPAEARVHRHNQYIVNNVKHFAEGLHGRSGIDRHTDLSAATTDQLQAAVQMATGFLMDRNPVRAGIGKSRDIFVGVLDHQVAVEGNVHRFA